MEARRGISQSVQTGLVSFAVFVVGLFATIVEYNGRVQEQLEDRTRIERDAARRLHYELQRRLDSYENANRDLAALFSSSQSITEREFKNFLTASRFLERLNAISFTGYLPKVEADRRHAFERAQRAEHPTFRLRPPVTQAPYLFPLLYSQQDETEDSAESLRGLDYAANPARYQAMQFAAEQGSPTASLVHASAGGRKSTVVLVFTPIRRPDVPLAPPGQRMEQVAGFTLSVMRMDELLARLYAELGAGQFELQVYERQRSADTVVFDSNGAVPLADEAVYKSELQFANQRWSAHFFPIGRDTAASGFNKLVLVVGVMLSLIAAYAVVVVQRLLAARREGRELQDRFESFYENHPFPVCSLDPHWRLLHANQKMAEELRTTPAALVGRYAGDFVPPELREMSLQRFEEALRGKAVAYHNVMVDANGQQSDVSVLLIPLTARGKTTRVLAFAENITERKRAEAELHSSRQMLRLILDTVPQRIFWKDLNGVYQGGNRHMLDAAGLARVEELIGKTDYDMPWRDLAKKFQEEDAEVAVTRSSRVKEQCMQRRGDGTEYWMESSKLPLLNDQGNPVGVLGVVDDITERKATEQELFRRANFDSLTALPNRSHFYAQLVQALKRSCRRQAALALMYFDIDHFKQINDTHGHDVGDEVIRSFARRIRSVLRDEDFVARLGGDEFILIAENLAGHSAAEVIAEKMVAALAQPIRVGDFEIPLSTSIGIAYFKEGMTSDQLVKAADNAMYEAKRAGRNCFRRAA